MVVIGTSISSVFWRVLLLRLGCELWFGTVLANVVEVKMGVVTSFCLRLVTFVSLGLLSLFCCCGVIVGGFAVEDRLAFESIGFLKGILRLGGIVYGLLMLASKVLPNSVFLFLVFSVFSVVLEDLSFVYDALLEHLVLLLREL